jgi:hypothetical protein
VKQGIRTGHSVPVDLAQVELQVDEGQPTIDQHGEAGDKNRTLSTCGTDPARAPGRREAAH